MTIHPMRRTQARSDTGHGVSPEDREKKVRKRK